jgi:hypothetical protein
MCTSFFNVTQHYISPALFICGVRSILKPTVAVVSRRPSLVLGTYNSVNWIRPSIDWDRVFLTELSRCLFIFSPKDGNRSSFRIFVFVRNTRRWDRLCGLVVRVFFYRSRGPGFDSRRFQIFWEAAGLERGPVSLLRTTEELLGRKSSGSGLENRD